MSDEQKLVAVCELVKGSTLLKAGRSGKPHFRQFRLSPDLTRLMWESKKVDAAVLISQITEIKLGQVTPVFLKNPIPQCEAFSFSLLYSDRSLDIVCKDKNEFDTWTTGVQALLDGYNDQEAVTAKLNEMGGSASKVKLSVQLGTIKTTVKVVNENSSHLYTWGGGGRGRLGHKEEFIESQPRVVESLLGQNVTMIACGGSHTMALNGKGQVFTWGAGNHGCLGHGNLRDRYSPLMIDDPFRGVNIAYITCYENHSAALSDDGNLFTWGKAGAFLGYVIESGKTKQVKPRLVQSLYGKKIRQVACGRSHTLACDEDGQVYSFGQNKFGELGQGHDKEVFEPLPISNLTNICKVVCGRHHSAALDEDGVLYMWGWGARGQLGCSELKSLFVPTVVNGFNEQAVEDVSCGYGHSAAVTGNGIVFCWGDNGFGQCGVSNSVCNEVPQPKPILTPTGTRPSQIICGANFTVLVTASGSIYTWGCGVSGQLGQGEGRKNLSQPVLIETLSEKRVKMVACGEEHVGCLVQHGWVPDDEAKGCMACRKTFTPIRRRHHCRQCGGVFCGSCSTKRFPLLDKGYADPVRVCDRCYVTLSSLSNPIS